MPRMLDRNKFPPGEFQLLLPEIGMKEPLQGSFNEMVEAFAKIIAKNPAQAQKNHWPQDKAGMEVFIDEYNARRCIAHGWMGFVEIDDSPEKKTTYGPTVWPRRQGNVVAGVETLITGVSIYKEMFGGSPPVEREEAERRAAICEVCPENERGGFRDWFVAQTAKALMELVGILNNKNLRTSKDATLGKCKACDCPMRAKVWPQRDVILKHMKQEQFAKLDPKCWIPVTAPTITKAAAGS